jgi:hypothetical protein
MVRLTVKVVLPWVLLMGGVLLGGCGSVGTHSARSSVSKTHFAFSPTNAKLLKGSSCNPVSNRGQLELQHLGNGKCRRYLMSSGAPVGNRPGTQSFKVPSWIEELSYSNAPALVSLVISTAQTRSFSFTATADSATDLMYCVSVKPVVVTVSGPQVGKTSNGVTSIVNAPCRYSHQGFADLFPTVKGDEYTVVVKTSSPAEWAMRIIN